VSIVQEPETSFKEDVAATKRVLAQQDGPCILVAHSYGGAIITEAGTDPSVAGLVYVAAHMPEAGENEADDGKRFPSHLSKSGAIKKTDGFTYLDPAQFHEYFAADLSAAQAGFMARPQVLNAADTDIVLVAAPEDIARAVGETGNESLRSRDHGHYVFGSGGTGKTHIGLALGLVACQQGLRVRFTTAASLVNELIEARDEKRLLRYQKHPARQELLIVDELGFVPLSKAGAEMLFEVSASVTIAAPRW
jgi:pimeloyl-ACP methyl ester carboxylesterase